MNRMQSPSELIHRYPLSLEMAKTRDTARQTIRRILDKQDPRMLFIVGPCSFHDPKACMDYAHRLKKLATEVADTIFMVMRVHVEKPRTDLGWKGYLNDPYLNETYCIQEGVISARKFMLELFDLNLPIASEILNPMSYLYFQDLLSWGSIGARTVESQPHREIASSLTFPIGIKNAISGNIKVAANCIAFSAKKQTFMGMNAEGYISVIHAPGNPYAHLVLRGGAMGCNYKHADIQSAENTLTRLKLPTSIMVDCSHGNSLKNHLNQEQVLLDVLTQKSAGNLSIVGVILESFLEAGNQAIPGDINQLHYGLSITDSCLGWEDTERMIKAAHHQLAEYGHRPTE